MSIAKYDSFYNPDVGYSDFLSRLESVIKVLAPIKTMRMKKITSEWFDGKIADNFHARNKLYKMLNHQKTLCWPGYIQRSEIRSSKFNSIKENRMQTNTENSKRLWETIKQLGFAKKDFPLPLFVSKSKKV